MNDTQNNTPVKPKPQAKKPAPDASDNQSPTPGEFQQVLSLIKPLTDFHKAVDDATDDDFRIYWDVRLVRGKDTPYVHVRGSSTLSSMFAPKLRPHAVGVIQSEVRDKISAPLVAAFMTELEKETFEALARLRKTHAFATGEESPLDPLEPH
jgi:hypothetical protein